MHARLGGGTHVPSLFVVVVVVVREPLVRP
jgi:hypothetical protein